MYLVGMDRVQKGGLSNSKGLTTYAWKTLLL